MRRVLSLCVVIGISPAFGQEVLKRSQVNLVTEDSVLIQRTRAEIWPWILDGSAWKKTVRITHQDGPTAQVGEILAASLPSGSAEALYYMETVDLQPARRRTLKLFGAHQGPLLGYASWELSDERGGTRVTYRVFGELPASGGEPLAQEQARVTRENQTRFRDELEYLKRLVEARGKHEP